MCRNSIESLILDPNRFGVGAEVISEGLNHVNMCTLEVYSRVMQTLHRCIVLATGKHSLCCLYRPPHKFSGLQNDETGKSLLNTALKVPIGYTSMSTDEGINEY